MSRSDPLDLARRLDAVEAALAQARSEVTHLRRARTLQRAGAGLLVAAGAAGIALHVSRTEAQSPAEARRVTAPFEVVDEGGEIIFRVDEGGWTFFSGGAAVAGAAVDEGKGALMVGHANRAGNFARLAFTDDGAAAVQLISASRVVASLEATKEKSAKLEIFAGGEEPMLALGIYDDERAARVEVRNAAGKTAAMISAGKSGGAMRVFDTAGTPIGGLFARATGGGLALTGPGGGASAVSLSVGETGGKVQVASAGGGPFHAELGAYKSGGAVTLYTPGGEPAAHLYARETGAGQLEITRDGAKLVEAGVTASGLGIVLTGPGGRGGSSISGTPDSFILGRKAE